MRIDTILEVKNLKKYFSIGSFFFGRSKISVKAVDNVSFKVNHGETVGLVGESGCGKTTLGKTILWLIKPSDGDVFFEGTNLCAVNKKQRKKIRRDMQIIFQDPWSSLNPMFTMRRIVNEPFKVHGIGKKRENDERILELTRRVGLNEKHLYRYPHEFSGGQRQRIAIIRALALNPKFIVLDEPTSALDVSVQAQILNLLKELQGEFKLTYLFISHDLSVVKHMADRITVMYAGKIVEIAEAQELFKKPLHPYTQALLSVIPTISSEDNRPEILLRGSVPSLINPPLGCRFNPRCPHATQKCREKEPILEDIEKGHSLACHLSERN